MDLFDLAAKLTLDSSEYEKGLDNAENTAESKGSKIGSVLSKAGKTGAVAIGAIGAGITALSTTMINGAKKTASYGDDIDKMSQKMGISAEAYQEWDAILQHSGTSIDSMSRGMQTLQKNAVNSADKFEKLGLSQEEVASMSTEELFAATIKGLQEMGEGAERTALASELLGGSAKELGALLNTSAEDTEAMRQRVHELGGVMSDEAVKNAAAFQDSLQDMQTSMSGLGNKLMGTFMPSITGVMDGLTAIFAGDDSGLTQINQGVSDFANNLIAQLPKILEVGTNIIEGLATAIIENIPALFDAAMEVITKLVGYLIENLPLIIESALEIVIALANGIAEALPELIPTIIDVIIQIVGTLIDNADMLVDAAIAIILGLANGLIDALPTLIEKAPEIIEKLVKAFIRNAPKLLKAGLELLVTLVKGIINAYAKLFEVAKEIIAKIVEGIKNGFTQLKEKGKEIIDNVKKGIVEKINDAKNWGKDMIQNFIDGITAKWQALKDKVSNVASTVKDFLGFSEPKEGPLSNFHTYAPDMMKLFAKGIADNEDLISNQIAKSFDIKSDIPMVTSSQKYGTINTDTRSADSIIINLLTQLINRDPVFLELDEDGLFKIVRRKNIEFSNRYGMNALL